MSDLIDDPAPGENAPEFSVSDLSGVIKRMIEGEFSHVRVKGEVRHAILCHHTEEDPLTTEAGVIRVSDGLDMEHGRSRLPYERGGRGINTLSSQAIQRVSLQAGEDVPVLVEIEMRNAAGVYQKAIALMAAQIDGGCTATQCGRGHSCWR